MEIKYTCSLGALCHSAQLLHLCAFKMRKVTLPFNSFTPTKWAF